MALTHSQLKIMARHNLAEAKAKREAEPSKHEALLAAFRRLDEPLLPAPRPIDPAAKYLTPEQLREQHPEVAAILLPPSGD
jgi:hypothetical protein